MDIPTVHLIGPISNRLSALPMFFSFLLFFCFTRVIQPRLIVNLYYTYCSSGSCS